MIFKQFYLPSLGHASYFVGSEQTGESLVLDVRRDVDAYFAEARSRGMRIRYAADTHQHNDYVTGICELPARADVQLIAGARAELNYNVRSMGDGDRLDMGEVIFEVWHTPGHTPEHISLLVTDRSRGDEPILQRLTRAPGNNADIGGLKVVTENGWFAARPSGTEDVYKIYAESFRDAKHLESIVDEARQIVSDAFARG